MGAYCTCSELLQSCSVNLMPALPRSVFVLRLSGQLRCDEKISTTEAVLAAATRAAPAAETASGFTPMFPRAPMPMPMVVRRSERNARGVDGAPAMVNPWHVAQQARQASSDEAARSMLRCFRVPKGVGWHQQGGGRNVGRHWRWDFAMGYFQSKLVDEHCVDDLVRPPRVLAAPVTSGAARPCSTPPGGARQGPIIGFVLQSAAPTGPSP